MKFNNLIASTGVRNMLLATFFFAVMNVFVKELSALPAMEIVFFRCLIAALLCFAGLAKFKVDWRGSNRMLLLLRGSFGTAALFTFFLTVQNLPLATAVTIQYLSPIFTTAIAVFLLGERVRKIQWLFYALAFAGVLIIKGFDKNLSLQFLSIGVFSAFAAGAAYALVRSLSEKEQPLIVVLHFQLVGAAVGFVATLFNWKAPSNLWEWFCLLMTGILTQAGQICLTKSLQAAPISNVSILNYTGLVYALVFGTFIFGETYTWQTLFGILIIVGSVVASIGVGKQRAAIVDETDFAFTQPNNC